MLAEKVRQLTFLYDTKSPDYRDQHMRANAREGIGKGLKIKRKFHVSLRDVGIVCPRLNNRRPVTQRFAYLAHEYFMGKQNNINLRK
jgi:hypothetical protein